MDFSTEKKAIEIKNPPIIQGSIESILKLTKFKGKRLVEEERYGKVVTSVIKHNTDNNFFHETMNNNNNIEKTQEKIKIASPPNFLY